MPGRDQLLDLLDAPAASAARNLFGLSNQQLTELMKQLGQPSYRARQVQEAIFRHGTESVEAITTLPASLRQEMGKAGWTIQIPSITEVFRSADGTERYLISCSDGKTVESVWMPEGDGGDRGNFDSSPAGAEKGGVRGELQDSGDRRRATICVSSQIGCAVNCQFCLTAKLGLERNLSAGEIAGQVLAVLRRHSAEAGKERINVVFMGMGEPFLNYDAFMSAVRLLVEEVGLSESRMTVSTSGIVPGILRFAEESVRPRLAISLNATEDATRERVMPITRKWKIGEVLEAASRVPLKPRERITFEYVLLAGVNDSLEDAAHLARLARRARFPVKINLISWNPGPGIAYQAPKADRVIAFQNRVIHLGVPAFLRKPRGQDIFAACGQLKRTENRNQVQGSAVRDEGTGESSGGSHHSRSGIV